MKHSSHPSNPPSVCYMINDDLYLAGSEWYRAHRPAHVLGNKLDWLTFVASHFRPPEKAGEMWQAEVWIEQERLIITPQVIITRPLFAMKGWDTEGLESAAKMTEAIAYAQEAGQIVIVDLDDHPYAWNAEFAERENVEPIKDWIWLRDYFSQANAILCSTPWLVDFMRQDFPKQHLALAPNLYDPWRYVPRENPQTTPVIGSHIYTSARMREDFEMLRAPIGHLFDAIPELIFHHIGEQYICQCSHNRGAHWKDDGPCDGCRCEQWTATTWSGHAFAELTGLDRDRVKAVPQSSLMDLPDKMDWSFGVVPLCDSEFNHAKTEGKGFEMAAGGIPFFAITGNHPLYQESPGYVAPSDYDLLPEVITECLNNPKAYQRLCRLYRKWAETIAQRHEIDYLATMRRLAMADLKKARHQLTAH